MDKILISTYKIFGAKPYFLMHENELKKHSSFKSSSRLKTQKSPIPARKLKSPMILALVMIVPSKTICVELKRVLQKRKKKSNRVKSNVTNRKIACKLRISQRVDSQNIKGISTTPEQKD